MRVLLLSHYYAPETGPPQLRWSALAREFASAGHNLDVIAPHPHYPSGSLLEGYTPQGDWQYPEQGAHGESIYRVRFRPTRGTLRSVMIDQLIVAAGSVAAVARLRRRLAPDVIIATAPALPTLLAGWLAKMILRRPLVVEIRDAWPDLIAVADRWEGAPQRASFRKRVALRFAPHAITWLQRRADRVVTTTATFADVIRARGVRHVSVIRNTAHPIPNYSNHVPRTPTGTLRVVYVGTVGRAQGLQTAIEAIRIARAAGVDIEMRVIGAGVGKEIVSALAEQHDLPVIVRGAQSRADIHHHYRWGDTFLVMLRDWEPLAWTVPSKLYEAMSIGMHVSGSVTGEAADIIRESQCGFIAPPEDPDALAAQWIAMAAELPPRPEVDLARKWLAENADEARAAELYLDLLHRIAADREPPTDISAQSAGHQ